MALKNPSRIRSTFTQFAPRGQPESLGESPIEGIARTIIIDHVPLSRHERIVGGFHFRMAIIISGITLVYDAVVRRGTCYE